MAKFKACSDERHDSIRGGLKPSLSMLYDELAEAVGKFPPPERREKLMAELEAGTVEAGDKSHGIEEYTRRD